MYAAECFAFFLFSASTLFFFQAEDGIRDGHVTGVQTCALPIWPSRTPRATRGRPHRGRGAPARLFVDRSEERRVGKECRPRRTPDHSDKKTKLGREMQNTDAMRTSSVDIRLKS